MYRKITAVFLLFIILFLLSACSYEIKSSIRTRLGVPLMNTGTTTYTLEEVRQLYNENKEDFHKIAQLLSNKTTYWETLYDETEWHAFMLNYTRNNEYFSEDELEYIEDFYKKQSPMKSVTEMNTKRHSELGSSILPLFISGPKSAAILTTYYV